MPVGRQGFTLIELLVVIAIIGLLSTLAVVSLNSARAKARDAKRVSDVKQISTLVEMEAANSATGGYDIFPAECDGSPTPPELLSACTIGNVDLSTITDPSGSTTGCDAGVLTPCAYAVSVPVTATNYEICFYLEEGAGSVGAGLNSVTAGSVMVSGCN